MALTIKKASGTLQGVTDVQSVVVPISSTVQGTPGTGYLSVAAAVTAVSAVAVSTTLTAGTLYLYSCSCGSWISQGTTATAAIATAGSVYVGAGQAYVVDGNQGSHFSAIADTSLTGSYSLTQATA